MRLLILSILFSFSCSFAQISIYNPEANAGEELIAAIKVAKAENKHVLLQIGGNWCPWCVKLNSFIKEDLQIDSLICADYVILKINYSKEQENEEIMKELDFPQRFGFPVLVVLDKDGNRLHTQNSWFLEDGKSYSRDKIIAFLKNWNIEALNPEKYK